MPDRSQVVAAYEARPDRKADKRFYASPRWRRFRLSYLRAHPFCADCEREGRHTLAEHVHHVVERKVDPDRAFDETNVKGLCEPCHSKYATWGRR